MTRERSLVFLLAAIAVATGPRSAFAASIDLLKEPVSMQASTIVVEMAGSDRGDDEASADEDCVVLDDAPRASSSPSPLGAVRFHFGQLLWDWDTAGEPSNVYVRCAGRRDEGAFTSGLALLGGIGWRAVPPATPPAGPQAIGAAGRSESDSTPRVELPIPSPSPTTIDSRPTGDAWPPFEPSNVFAISLTSTTPDGQRVNNTLAPPSFDAPINLDPREMTPIPEPGSLVLLTIGLAGVWRRRRPTPSRA